MKHTFSVLAYKESPHLEDCIQSLRAQSCATEIILCTSTPNTHIETIAQKYSLELYVNPEKKGIAADWNFALKQAKTQFVTLAHQDDSYDKQFVELLLAAAERNPESSIIFPDYREQKGSEYLEQTTNLKIKRWMLKTYFIGCESYASQWRKHATLLFGSPISCPAIMYNTHKLEGFSFNTAFDISLDWEAWLQLAHRAGAFTWVRQILMTHRIHEDSATTSGVRAGKRQKEDNLIFEKLWPWPFSKIFASLYEKSLNGNNTSKTAEAA